MRNLTLIAVIILIFISINCSSEKQNKVVLCMGDSITESVWGNYPAQLNNMFRKKSVSCTAISQGRPGNTSGEYLSFFSKSNILEKYDPNMIVIMLGTNDVRIDYDKTPTAKYKENMAEILNIIKTFETKKKKKIDIYICTILPIFTPDLNTFTVESARRIDMEIVPAILELSIRFDLELIDLYSVFKMNKDLLPGIHPSPGGYYKIAKVIFNRIMKDSMNHCFPCE